MMRAVQLTVGLAGVTGFGAWLIYIAGIPKDASTLLEELSVAGNIGVMVNYRSSSFGIALYLFISSVWVPSLLCVKMFQGPAWQTRPEQPVSMQPLPPLIPQTLLAPIFAAYTVAPRPTPEHLHASTDRELAPL